MVPLDLHRQLHCRANDAFFAGNDPAVLTRAFGIFAAITLIAAFVLALVTPLIKKMTPRAA